MGHVISRQKSCLLCLHLGESRGMLVFGARTETFGIQSQYFRRELVTIYLGLKNNRIQVVH